MPTKRNTSGKNQPRTIKSEYVLFVEGKDEENFFKALFETIQLREVPQIIDVGGKDGFSLYALVPGLDKVVTVGFVRDADGSCDSAFQSIKDCIAAMNKENPYTAFPVPSKPNAIVSDQANGKKCGVFIMPDNASAGMLEDLCLASVKGSKECGCIDEYFRCISATTITQNRSKAVVQIYLASQTKINDQTNPKQFDVCSSLGLGAQKGKWDFTHKCFDEMKRFLTALYQ